MTTSHASTDTALWVSIVLLTMTTAIVHLHLAFPDSAFVLNGLGYLTLLAAPYLPIPRVARYRNTVRRVLIGYAALTIFL